MTTLEQQIAHLQDYWNVPQEDIDLLVKLAVKDYFDKQAVKRTEFLNKAVMQMKANNIYNDEKTIAWEIENYNKYRDAKANKLNANKYKLTITDCATGNVVQEIYLPKN
jgi:hypothetical protein